MMEHIGYSIEIPVLQPLKGHSQQVYVAIVYNIDITAVYHCNPRLRSGNTHGRSFKAY